MTSTRTTRYVTLLSVVLATALTAVLVACGSDEPSGGTGPDRTASTPTETPASPARTPSATGAVDAPTATDEPVPATATATVPPTATDAPVPATAPPAASGSAQTDREALVAFYNATNGEKWTFSDNWLSDAPHGQWPGVLANNDGRVIGLDLRGNRLSGGLPAELGSLSKVTHLYLQDNGLTGEIPAELGSLSNLEVLDLSFNDLSGKIPCRTRQPLQPGRAGHQLQRVDWGDTGGVGQPLQPANTASLQQPVKRGDTGGTGQPLQPENAVALQQPIERGDTAGAGQSLQPARAGPQLQRLERVCAKQPGIPGAARWRRPAPLLKPRALSRGRTAYRPEGAPIACWLWRMALPSNVVSASPFVGLPVDGGLTAPAHADALDRQTFSQG